MRTHRVGSFSVMVLFLGGAALSGGCIAETDPPSTNAPGAQHRIIAPSQANTFIGEYLEIDQLGAMPPDDANLFTGADPADQSLSAKKPGPPDAAFIDWEDLAGDLENHRFLDLKDLKNNDLLSFPRANECVGPSKVLSKMDLVYAAAANNTEYAYFAVLRSSNNGDAGYYWLLTRRPPKLTVGADPCKPKEARLTYDISGPELPAGAADGGPGAQGDVLLAGHFKPSAEPLLKVYRATRDELDVSALNAVDFTSGLWQLDPAGVAAAAVNTSDTDPGLFGANGVKALTGAGHLEPELFAEAAVPMAVFTGGTPCGASYFASVITRSSGAGGTSPDLKDLLGPVLFNFGSVEAQTTLTPSCYERFGYSVTAIGMDGQPLANPECAWVFDGDPGQTSAQCSGTFDAAAGTHTGTVTVTEPISGCAATVKTGNVEVYPQLSMEVTLTPNCESGFRYEAEVTGGSNPPFGDYAWTFEAMPPSAGTASPPTANDVTGSVTVSPAGQPYRASVLYTDPRTDLVCQAEGSAEGIPYAPLHVHLDLRPHVEMCPPDDAVVYDAIPGGGKPPYSYLWTGNVACGDAPMCTVEASESLCADKAFEVTITDSSGMCLPAASETETYSKVTTITASNNP